MGRDIKLYWRANSVGSSLPWNESLGNHRVKRARDIHPGARLASKSGLRNSLESIGNSLILQFIYTHLPLRIPAWGRIKEQLSYYNSTKAGGQKFNLFPWGFEEAFFFCFIFQVYERAKNSSRLLRKRNNKIQLVIMPQTVYLVWTSSSNACMHAKSLQSCPTLCDPMLLCPWDSPGKNTGVGYSLLLYWFSVFPISFCMLTCMTQLSYLINKENDSLDTSDEFWWVLFCNSCLLAHLVAQLCLTLCDPADCSPWVSSVRGISQARILEWVVMASFRGSSRPRDWTCVSCIACGLFTCWATGKLL